MIATLVLFAVSLVLAGAVGLLILRACHDIAEAEDLEDRRG